MRVAFVHTSMSHLGGAEVAILQQATALSLRKVDVDIFTTGYDLSIGRFQENSRLKIHVVDKGIPLPCSEIPVLGRNGLEHELLMVGRSMVDAVKAKKYDVVLAGNFPASWIGWLSGRKTVWFCRGFSVPLYGEVTNPEEYLFHKSTYNAADLAALQAVRELDRMISSSLAGVFTNSNYNRNHIKQILEVDAYVIRTGIDLQLFRRVEPTVRTELGLEDSVVVICATRQGVNKRPEEALLAFSHALKCLSSDALTRTNPKLLVVGNSGIDGQLLPLSQELGLRDRLVLTGRVPHEKMNQYYSASDILVYTSLRDTFGLPPIEAMACNLPVIVYDDGGPGENIVQGVTGIKVPPGDWKSLGNELARLIQSTKARQRLGEQGRAFVEKEFSWEDHATKLKKALERVANN